MRGSKPASSVVQEESSSGKGHLQRMLSLSMAQVAIQTSVVIILIYIVRVSRITAAVVAESFVLIGLFYFSVQMHRFKEKTFAYFLERKSQIVNTQGRYNRVKYLALNIAALTLMFGGNVALIYMSTSHPRISANFSDLRWHVAISFSSWIWIIAWFGLSGIFHIKNASKMTSGNEK